MSEHDPLIERLYRMADGLPVQISDPKPIRRRAGLRKMRSRAIGGLSVAIVALAVVLPLRSLSGLGGDAVVPRERPWTETYVLSEFEVEYPKHVLTKTGQVKHGTPLVVDPTKALVTFRSAWSGDTYPGEAPCSIELFDRDGASVGSQSFNLVSMTPVVDHQSEFVIRVEGGPPVKADGACGPGTQPGPGTYVFTGLRVVTDGDDRLVADVAWSTDEPPLTQSCIASFTMADGVHDERVFTLDAGQGVDMPILLLPRGFAGATPLGVSCEPGTTDQELTPAPSEAPDRDTYQDPDNAFSVQIPPGWQRADRRLTDLIDPVEIFSAGTFTMRPGGSCPQFPTNAIADMGPHDALVTILERKRLGPTGAQAPPRPASFGPTDGSGNSEVEQCLGTGKAFFDRSIAFSDQGREFYAFVAMGSDVSDQRRDDTWSVLDSLTFDAATWTTSMVSIGEPAVVRDGEGRTWILVEMDDSPFGSFQAEGPVPACDDGSAGQVEIVGDHQGIQLTCKDGDDAGWLGEGRALDSNPSGYGGSLGVMPLVAGADGTLTRVEP